MLVINYLRFHQRAEPPVIILTFRQERTTLNRSMKHLTKNGIADLERHYNLHT
ncbi:hypothetical protein CHS0354_010668, partial [Potamilus streckersoni]